MNAATNESRAGRAHGWRCGERSFESVVQPLNDLGVDTAKAAVAKGLNLTDAYKEIHGLMKPVFGDYVIFEHCMPFNVTRAYEEAQGIKHPKIWTAEKDKEMWFALQASI